MGMPKALSAALRFLRTVVLIDLGMFAAVGLICWLGGWRTISYYSNGLILAGVAAWVLGGYGVNSGWQTTRSFDYQYAASAGVDSVRESANRERKEIGARYAFLAQMFIVGATPVAVGILIQLALGLGPQWSPP